MAQDSAILGSWAEDVAFVGYFAVRTVREQSGHQDRRTGARYYLLTFSLAFWSLLIELGPAETIDKFVRPALLYEIPHGLHSLAIGFVVAKFSADIVYYLFAYAGRTIRVRFVRYGPPGLPQGRVAGRPDRRDLGLGPVRANCLEVL